MTAISMSVNRHPVDRLADVGAQIKTLEDLEKSLKDEVSRLMGQADSLGGDEFIARQTVSTRKGGIDDKAAKVAGVDLDQFRKADVTVYTLRVERRAVEAA